MSYISNYFDKENSNKIYSTIKKIVFDYIWFGLVHKSILYIFIIIDKLNCVVNRLLYFVQTEFYQYLILLV